MSETRGTTVTIRVPYKTVNNVSIPTDIHIPVRTTGRHDSCPVLIIIHGGGFVLGSSSMNNKDQIADCLERGWIVISPEHRLCPGVNVLEGPMADVRDLLSWSQQGGLARALQVSGSKLRPDPDRVMAMGTSAGGHLALCLAWDVPKPPLAILDFYGAKCFEDDFWSKPVAQIQGILPPKPPAAFFAPLFAEKETFTGGVSLEGQAGPAAQGPDFTDPRQAYVLYNIGEGKMLQSIWPQTPTDLHLIDPYLNINPSWPPTVIVHGNKDFMIPIHISKDFEARLKENNVESALIEVEGEPHTFVGKMEKGSQTWVTQRQGFDFLDNVLSRSYNE